MRITSSIEPLRLPGESIVLVMEDMMARRWRSRAAV